MSTDPTGLARARAFVPWGAGRSALVVALVVALPWGPSCTRPSSVPARGGPGHRAAPADVSEWSGPPSEAVLEIVCDQGWPVSRETSRFRSLREACSLGCEAASTFECQQRAWSPGPSRRAAVHPDAVAVLTVPLGTASGFAQEHVLMARVGGDWAAAATLGRDFEHHGEATFSRAITVEWIEEGDGSAWLLVERQDVREWEEPMGPLCPSLGLDPEGEPCEDLDAECRAYGLRSWTTSLRCEWSQPASASCERLVGDAPEPIEHREFRFAGPGGGPCPVEGADPTRPRADPT